MSRFYPSLIWALVILAIIYRVVASQYPALSNTSPTMALCFGGGFLLLGKSKGLWWIPALLVLASDILIGMLNGGGGIGGYTMMTITIFCAAAWLGQRASSWTGRIWPAMWCGVLISSLFFYLAANTYAWAVFPGYAKSLTGWWQSQTTGLPGFPPSWLFLRNAIIGDTIWCVIAGLAFFWKPADVRETATA